jgi:hypothetical protein
VRRSGLARRPRSDQHRPNRIGSNVMRIGHRIGGGGFTRPSDALSAVAHDLGARQSD